MTRHRLLRRSLPLLGGLSLLPGCTSSEAAQSDTGASSNPTTTADDGTQTGGSQAEDTTSALDTGASSGAAETAGADSTTGDSGCAGTCVAAVPDGWFGPTVHARLAAGAATPPCPDDYPTPGPTLVEGFNEPGPAQCDCSCTLMAGSPCTATLTFHTDDCEGYAYGMDSVSLGPECNPTPIVNELSSVELYAGNGGSCQKEDTEFVPPISWDATIQTCRLPEETPLACNDGASVCLPAAPEGFENKWCIYKQGEVECPVADFTEKLVFHTNAEDTRDCSSCSCSSPGGSCSEGTLQLFDEPDCAGEATQEVVLSADLCQVLNAASFAADFGGEQACSVTTAPVASGSATPVGPFTFCCG